MAAAVTGYSAAQVALHWIVAVLVAFQYFASAAMETAWRASLRGEPSADLLASLHAAGGILILLLASARIWLRLARGAPPPPQDEPRAMQILAEAVHYAIYALLFLLPATGAAAWFLNAELPGSVHGFLQRLLLGAIALHVAGGLFQHIVRRSGVLMRMFRPERS
jgi:cytochrome b561